MPEATFGPEDLRSAVEAAVPGARFVGLQPRRDRPPLVLFDLGNGTTTLTLDPAALVTEQVRRRLTERPEAVVLGALGGRVVEQLARIAEGLELLVQVELVGGSDAWSETLAQATTVGSSEAWRTRMRRPRREGGPAPGGREGR